MFFPRANPRIVLKSGAILSIQASSSHYCLPRKSHGPYSHYEVGNPKGLFPIDLKELSPYEDGEGSGIYAYVPSKILEKIMHRHDGILEGRMPGLPNPWDN